MVFGAEGDGIQNERLFNTGAGICFLPWISGSIW